MFKVMPQTGPVGCHCDTSAEAADAAGAGVLLNRICHSFSGSSPEYVHPTDGAEAICPHPGWPSEAKKVCLAFIKGGSKSLTPPRPQAGKPFKRKGVQMLVGHRESERLL